MTTPHRKYSLNKNVRQQALALVCREVKNVSSRYLDELPVVIVSPEKQRYELPPNRRFTDYNAVEYPRIFVNFVRLREKLQREAVEIPRWLEVFENQENAYEILRELELKAPGDHSLEMKPYGQEEGERYYPVNALSVVRELKSLGLGEDLLNCYTLIELEAPKWVHEVSLHERHVAHVKYVGAYEDLDHYLEVLYRRADREARPRLRLVPPPPPEDPIVDYATLLEKSDLSDPEQLPALDESWAKMDEAQQVRAENLLELTKRIRYPGDFLVEDYQQLYESLKPFGPEEQRLVDEALLERSTAITSWKERLKEFDRIILALPTLQRAIWVRKRRAFAEKIRASQRLKELA